MDCPPEEAILAYCRGRASTSSRATIEAHLSRCEPCHTVALAFIRARAAGPFAPESQSADPMSPTTPLDGELVMSKSAPVAPGDVLAGKYEVERVLGVGGMGVVVAARHQQLEQRVALKFLLPDACEVPGAIERFLREGQAAARIASEHVARVLDTGVLEDGAPYLVLEYLEGRDLGAEVEARGRLPWQEAVTYVLQACEALAVAHQMGVIHRDLKPPNLFLTKRADGSPLVKVLDFGISKVMTEGVSQNATSTSAMMGSPRYMSPEQMVSTKNVDARTDVWALGVVLFELVTGQPVWVADTVQGLAALIVTAPAPRLSRLVPDVPPALDVVVQGCLAKRFDERIASVADLALALLPLAPPEARASAERVARIARRSLPPEGAAASAQPGARGYAVGVSSLGPTTLPPRGRARPWPLVFGGLIALGAASLAAYAWRSPDGAGALPPSAREAATAGVAPAATAELIEVAPSPEALVPVLPAEPLTAASEAAASEARAPSAAPARAAAPASREEATAASAATKPPAAPARTKPARPALPAGAERALSDRK